MLFGSSGTMVVEWLEDLYKSLGKLEQGNALLKAVKRDDVGQTELHRFREDGAPWATATRIPAFEIQNSQLFQPSNIT